MFEREKMQLVEKWESGAAVRDKRVLDAFKKIRRELFVLDEYKDQSYVDEPLPILAGQTISQPTTVVLMLDALEVRPGQKVLEIGAGSGYNAALLSVLVGKNGKVITTEIVPELVEFAKNNLKKAGISNVKVIHSDGSIGYAREAPYDRIVCTAAAPRIPKALKDQLKEGGILLIPVGSMYAQRMIKARKVRGKLETEDLGDYVFVPLIGKFGIKE
ncbi:MAG: protein-L-isoaspartate(D-aspartate) O-methyltransferase [Candidatus Woesearchaeota archaeon]